MPSFSILVCKRPFPKTKFSGENVALEEVAGLRSRIHVPPGRELTSSQGRLNFSGYLCSFVRIMSVFFSPMMWENSSPSS